MTILNIKNINLQMANENKAILSDINYVVNPGDFIILVGSNGSGKSSLLKLLYKHYKPTAGEIQFLDKPIASYSPKEFNRHVSVLTQHFADSLFTSLTVYENYLLVKRKHHILHGKHEKKFLMEYLLQFNPNLSHKLDMTINVLSGGEKQALALALCLLYPPTLLLLDEHSSALDPKTSDQIMQLTQQKISEHHITCILATHDLDIALRYGNRILMLHEGRIEKIIEQDEKITLTKANLLSNYSSSTLQYA